VFSAVNPTDFIEEIWIHDIVDVTWNLFRLRRIQAAFLTAKVSADANDQACALAEAQPELMEGTEEEKEEMKKLLDSDSELSWETRVAQYPRANEKFQKFWASAESTLDKDAIQAKIMIDELDTIEQFEHFITIAQQRFDAVIREMDRHRVVCDSVKLVEVEKPKMIVQNNK